jgi:hypothetical protein
MLGTDANDASSSTPDGSDVVGVQPEFVTIRLHEISKKALEDFATKTRAKTRNKFANVMLRLGVQKLPGSLVAIESLYRVLRQVIMLDKELFKKAMEQAHVSSMAEIDETLAFFAKLKEYLMPTDLKQDITV